MYIISFNRLVKPKVFINLSLSFRFWFRSELLNWLRTVLLVQERSTLFKSILQLFYSSQLQITLRGRMEIWISNSFSIAVYRICSLKITDFILIFIWSTFHLNQALLVATDSHLLHCCLCIYSFKKFCFVSNGGFLKYLSQTFPIADIKYQIPNINIPW